MQKIWIRWMKWIQMERMTLKKFKMLANQRLKTKCVWILSETESQP
jgi:hypothetical protein